MTVSSEGGPRGMGDAADAARAAAASAVEPVSAPVSSKADIAIADSGVLEGYYGILNAQGQFWSHTVHASKDDARDYIRRFWGADKANADWCLRKFKIVPVRATLVALEAREIEIAKSRSRRKATARRIEAGTDETPQAAQPEGREPDPKGRAQ